MSWSTSVTEFNRYLDYICKHLLPCQIRADVQSTRHAQLEIVRITRPMLEAMRNILRNITLWNMESPNRSIELLPRVSNRLATVCLQCKSSPHRIGNFWVANRSLHDIDNECCTCRCSLDQHKHLDYILEYKFTNHRSRYSRNEMKNMLDQLCSASAQLYAFLLHLTPASEDDPFQLGLVKMIAEENDLSENVEPNYLNLQLVNDLKRLQNKYEQRKSGMAVNQENGNVVDIYALINTIQEYPMVREQIAAMKKGQQLMIKEHEYEVPRDLRSTLRRSSATH